jgi:Uma2 family endonuclease
MTIENAKPPRWKKLPSSRTRAVPPPLIDDSVEAYPPHPGRRMTETEFLNWVKEKTRAEWVEGEVIIMSPVNNNHDQIQGWITRLLGAFVEEHDLGRVCNSEFYIHLPTPVCKRLPDAAFISAHNPGKFTNNGFVGSPDLIVEIVSPDSTYRDYREKLEQYQSSHVKEYWLIDPLSERVAIHELTKSKYRTLPETAGVIHSKVLKGLYLKPAWLWQRPLPKVAAVLREMSLK